jgi:hypothetical protein
MTRQKGFTQTYPLAGVGRDDVHVHADEGDDAAGDGARVLDDDVAPALGVADLPHDERAAPGLGGHRAERVDDVPRHEVLLRPVDRRVVLQARGLADKLGEEGDEAVALEAAHGVLERRRRRRCHLGRAGTRVLGRRRRRGLMVELEEKNCALGRGQLGIRKAMCKVGRRRSDEETCAACRRWHGDACHFRTPAFPDHKPQLPPQFLSNFWSPTPI